jgi:hypothetical protein
MMDIIGPSIGMLLPYVFLAIWLGGAWWIWTLMSKPEMNTWLQVVLAILAGILSGVVCAGIAIAVVFAVCSGMKI